MTIDVNGGSRRFGGRDTFPPAKGRTLTFRFWNPLTLRKEGLYAPSFDKNASLEILVGIYEPNAANQYVHLSEILGGSQIIAVFAAISACFFIDQVKNMGCIGFGGGDAARIAADKNIFHPFRKA